MADKNLRNNKVREEPRESKSRLEEAAAVDQRGWLVSMREWLDALIIAFVLAMFIRTFVVELFKIPSGSMSPTLLGDWIAEGAALDENNQSNTYLFIRDRQNFDFVQIFKKDKSGHLQPEPQKRPIYTLTTSQQDLIRRETHLEEHRIFVNKFAYWFKKPDRGDIVVFRVPFEKKPTVYERDGQRIDVKAYDRNQGVYVKRALAFDGEHVEIDEDHRLVINGEPVTKPPILDVLRYSIPITREYSVTVPEGQLFAFGDNTDNSLDSRFWGGIPYGNLRGKAFFRYWPIRKVRFLNN